MQSKKQKLERRLFTRTVTCAAISFIAGIIVMIPVMQVYAQNMYMSQVEQQAQDQIEQENVVTMQNMTTAKQEQLSFAKSNNQIELISFEGNGKGGTDLTQTVLSEPLNVLADNANIETISVSGDEIKLEPELPKISGTEMLKQQEGEPEEINISEGEEAEMSKQEEAESEEAEMSKQEEAESEEAEMPKQEETEGQQTEEIKIPASVVEQMQEQAEKKQEETSVSENNVQKEDEEETIEITTIKSLEMYEKPDTSSDKIRTLKKGVKLSNVEEVGGGWLKVTYKEKDGYIYYLNTDYAEKSGKKVKVQEEYEGGTRGFVNGRNVNLRKYPGITTEVIDCLEKETELKVISFNTLLEDEEHGWFLVVDMKTGKKGYMSGQYVYLGDELPKEERQIVETSKEVNTNKNQALANEDDVTILAGVCIAEAGGCGITEMGYAGQVFINRARINGRDLKSELLGGGYAKTTITKVCNGYRTTSESLELARQLLNGEINAFAGTPLETLYQEVYYQAGFEQGSNKWNSGIHWYGTKS